MFFQHSDTITTQANLYPCFVLQVMLQSEKQNSEDLGRKYSESEERSEERRKLLEETDKKVRQLQESLRG